MKEKIILLISFVFIVSITNAQKYAVAYCADTRNHILYIPETTLDVKNFKDCKDIGGYNTAVSVHECIKRKILQAVQAKARGGNVYTEQNISVIPAPDRYSGKVEYYTKEKSEEAYQDFLQTWAFGGGKVIYITLN